jgi:uncharacterized protein YcgI (DUF1989 family)
MASTATTLGAREHARSQAAGAAAGARTVPPWTADDLPDGVPAGDVVWDETLPPGRYTTKVLARGCRVRLTDVEGDACVQLLLFNALAQHERLNVADTVKVQWQAYLGEGSMLLTDMGRVLATIVHDSSGHHDTFCGAGAPARDLLTLGVARHGLDRRDVHPCIDLFKGVRVAADGGLTYEAGAGAGAAVELRLELPAVVVLANTAHVLDPRIPAVTTPARITAWSGTPAGPDDRWRTATPEAARAFENTDDWLAGHPGVVA